MMGDSRTSEGAAHSLLEAWSNERAVDHHCHPLRRWPLTVTSLDFRALFSETTSPGLLVDHVPSTAAYHDGLRRLAVQLGCEATEAAILAERNRSDPALYANALLKGSRTGALILDRGYSDDRTFSAEEHSRYIEPPQWEVVRLETLAEQLIETVATPDEWLAAIQSALRAAVQLGAVGVKSIAAYRSGLRLRPTSTNEFGAAFDDLRAQRQIRPQTRLAAPALCHPLLIAAADECVRLGIPIQIHCGFGDIDEDLADASPLGLRLLLRDPQYEGLRIVLLHCYPFHREAAYLCSVYPGVYMDLSLTLPLAGLDGKRAMREVLGLCPWSKLLYASDASRLPELYFIAAAVHREALASAFGDLVDCGTLSFDEAWAAGLRVLAANARSVYKLAWNSDE